MNTVSIVSNIIVRQSGLTYVAPDAISESSFTDTQRRMQRRPQRVVYHDSQSLSTRGQASGNSMYEDAPPLAGNASGIKAMTSTRVSHRDNSTELRLTSHEEFSS